MFGLAYSPTLALPDWQELVLGLCRTFGAMNRAHTTICGPYGEGSPIATEETIAFNGNLLGRHWWKSQPHIAGALGLDNDDAHEIFMMNRTTDHPTAAQVHLELNTAGKPYTLAVRAALLMVRHCYPDHSLITTAPGKVADWATALLLAQRSLNGVRLPPECRPGIVLRDMHPSILTLRHARG